MAAIQILAPHGYEVWGIIALGLVLVAVGLGLTVLYLLSRYVRGRLSDDSTPPLRERVSMPAILGRPRRPRASGVRAYARVIGEFFASGVRMIGRGILAVITTPGSLLQLGIRGLAARIVGETENYSTRVLSAALLVTGMLAVAGLGALLLAGAPTGTSSAPVLETVFDILTNLWVYAIVVAFIGRRFLLYANRLLARQAAQKTGYAYQSIRRLAEEAKQPDLSVSARVLAQTGDDPARIAQWIVEALDTGQGHETPSWGRDADTGTESGTQADTEPAGALPEPNVEDTAIVVHEGAEAGDQPLWARLRLMRLDMASAFDIERALWRFGGPFLLALVVQLVIVKVWAAWYVYPVILLMAAFVGFLYYWLTDLRQRRRLKTLRGDRKGAYWSDLSILVKTVEVPETTMYYGTAAGKTYASPHKEELAHTLASVADELVNEGYARPAPKIEERYAWLLERYIPTLQAWVTEREKPRIGDLLVDTVATAPDRIIPKQRLAEQVIEHGRGSIFGGLVEVGKGHDPDLVAECYRDLVRSGALVEMPVEIEAGDGTQTEVTAVFKGDETMPMPTASMRATFSERFQGRGLESRYDLPEVEQASGLEPFESPRKGLPEWADPEEVEALGDVPDTLATGGRDLDADAAD